MFGQVIKSLFIKQSEREEVPFVMYGKSNDSKEIFANFKGFNTIERQCAKSLYSFATVKEESKVQ